MSESSGPWQVVWEPEALREVRRLDRHTRVRMARAIDRLATQDYGDVRALRGQSGELRLRVGPWRVRFNRDAASRTLTILHVLPRSSAYED